MHNSRATLENNLVVLPFFFFHKVKHRITTNAAISLPGIYQSEIKAYVHSKP